MTPDWPGLCKDAAAAAFFSVAIAMMYTAPLRASQPTLAAGFAGSFVRDLSIACHLGADWSTLLGATAVVLIAVTTARGNRLSPVVLISAVLPLGGASAMFELIFSVMKASVAEGAWSVSKGGGPPLCGGAWIWIGSSTWWAWQSWAS